MNRGSGGGGRVWGGDEVSIGRNTGGRGGVRWEGRGRWGEGEVGRGGEVNRRRWREDTRCET